VASSNSWEPERVLSILKNSYESVVGSRTGEHFAAVTVKVATERIAASQVEIPQLSAAVRHPQLQKTDSAVHSLPDQEVVQPSGAIYQRRAAARWTRQRFETLDLAGPSMLVLKTVSHLPRRSALS